VRTHPIGIALDVDDDTAVQEAVEECTCDHLVVAQDPAPARDPQIGREADAALQVSLAHDLEECGGGLFWKWQVADLVDLSRCRDRSTYAETATIPTRR
jgi:hypothetical protein